MAEIECKVCENKIIVSTKGDNLLKCALCANFFHYNCLNMQFGTCKYIMSTPNCIWSCDSCSGSSGILPQILKQLELLTAKMGEYELQLKHFEVSQSSQSQVTVDTVRSPSPKRKNRSRKQLWSDIVSTNSSNIMSPAVSTVRTVTVQNNVKKPPVLVVKKKSEESELDIHSVLKKTINPIGDSYTSMHKTKSGKVIINCDDESAVEALKKKLSEKIGDQVEADRAKLSKPRIKIVGIQDIDNNDLLFKYLRKQNPSVISSESSLKVISMKKFTTYTTAVVECDYDTFVKVKKKKRLYVQNDSCKIYEHIDPQRCYKCNEFGHIANMCTSNVIICPKCGGEHKIDECTSQVSLCVNCKKANEKRNLNLPVDHFTWSPDCPI